jgi:DNA-binding transcriptional MocR family regulator
MRRYEQVAAELRIWIQTGVLKPGERLPGVRKLAGRFRVSVSTVQEALHMLEANKLVEVIERSGHYVRRLDVPRGTTLKHSEHTLKPVPLASRELAVHLVTTSLSNDIYQLGTTVPHSDFLPNRALNRAFQKVCREEVNHSDRYTFGAGYFPLREQIVLRMLEAGCAVSADQLVITNGCQSAMQLALSAVCQAGDVIAVESPTFHGLLQILESRGLRAIEIPTDPELGIDIDALAEALQQWPIKACVVLPNYSNPLGFSMPDDRKQALANLAAEHRMPIIENDIHGDLGFEQFRPKAIKSYGGDNVLYCSSFSKIIAPGLRVGWICAPHLQDQLEYLQIMHSLAAPSLPQKALALFLNKHRFDHHLRLSRSQYRKQVEYVSEMIEAYFPQPTKVTKPRGGFVIWAELPETVNTLRLYDRAIREKISIGPGPLFSANKQYGNCIRLNCALPIDSKLDRAIKKLARLVHEEM